MAYDKITLNPDTLSTNTILRFLEIEMSLGLKKLEKLFAYKSYPYKHAKETLIHYLCEDKKMLREDLDIAFSTQKFYNPSKDELIQYFRYKGLGVTKVTKITNSSPHTIQNYKDKYPDFTPVFPSWLGFAVLLNRWEELKRTLNLFDEELYHMKNTFRPTREPNSLIHPEEMPELIEKEESLEPITQWECAELWPMPSDFDPIISTYIMIQWNIAINGTTERLDQHLRDMIYNHELDSYLVPVLPYIQDHEEKKKLKDFLKL